ncbi:hypothetical protein GCM10027294_43490 [Marinactinospora endophytica]
MTEIAIRTDSLPERMEYARTLASSGLLPSAYRNRPENVLFAVEYGRALGLEPITAINSVHVIEGKPAASSGLISALVRRAGHTLRVRVDREPELVAIAQIIRADDPDYTFESRWSLERARRAGVAGKKVWQSFPEAMLKARAITEVAREACEEAILGVEYTPEELGAEVDAAGNIAESIPAQVRPGATIAEAEAEATTAQERPRVDPDRMRAMGRLMRHLGMGAEEALAFVSETVGREIGSRAEMEPGEVERVIDALEERDRARVAERVIEDAEIVDDTPAEEPA